MPPTHSPALVSNFAKILQSVSATQFGSPALTLMKEKPLTLSKGSFALLAFYLHYKPEVLPWDVFGFFAIP